MEINTVLPCYSIRQGSINDKTWIFELYCQSLRPAIEQTWGWDDEFQRNQFDDHLNPKKFQILLIDDAPVCGFYMLENEDHFWLEMLLVHPDHQGRGIGKSLVRQIQGLSARKGKTLKLCVIKANPVRSFYEKLGFRVYGEDNAFFHMEWKSSLEH